MTGFICQHDKSIICTTKTPSQAFKNLIKRITIMNEIIEKIIKRLEFVGGKKMSYKFDSSVEIDCALNDGNHFPCWRIYYDDNKYQTPANRLKICMFYDPLGSFFVNAKDVTEESLNEIYNQLPKAHVARIEFVDDVNFSGASTIVGRYPVFVDLKRDESFLNQLKQIMPSAEWEYNDVHEFVCYPFKGNDRQYLLATITDI